MKKSLLGRSHALSSVETLAGVSFLLIFFTGSVPLASGGYGSARHWFNTLDHSWSPPWSPWAGGWGGGSQVVESSHSVSIAKGAVESKGKQPCQFVET